MIDKFFKNLGPRHRSFIHFAKIFVPILVFLLLGGVAIVNSNNSATKKLLVERELLIRSQSDLLNPIAITEAHDGNILIAGYASLRAWAAKIGGDGKTIWEYRSPITVQHNPLVREAKFMGVVELPDGGVMLCGQPPFSKPNGQWFSPFVTKLDAAGNPIKESFIVSDKDRSSLIFLAGCARFGDGVAVVGVRPIYGNGRANILSPLYSYWVVLLNNNGEKRLEAEIPTRKNDRSGGKNPEVSLFPDLDSMRIFERGGLLWISATDGFDSEVVAVNSNGSVAFRKALNGRYQLIEDLSQSQKDISVYGARITDADAPCHSMSIDIFSHEMIEDMKSRAPCSFITQEIYRLADHSLVMFGFTVNSSGMTFKMEGRYVAPTLSDEEILNLKQRGFWDGLVVASTHSRNGEFIIARSHIPRARAGFTAAAPGNGMIVQYLKAR